MTGVRTGLESLQTLTAMGRQQVSLCCHDYEDAPCSFQPLNYKTSTQARHTGWNWSFWLNSGSQWVTRNISSSKLQTPSINPRGRKAKEKISAETNLSALLFLFWSTQEQFWWVPLQPEIKIANNQFKRVARITCVCEGTHKDWGVVNSKNATHSVSFTRGQNYNYKAFLH